MKVDVSFVGVDGLYYEKVIDNMKIADNNHNDHTTTDELTCLTNSLKLVHLGLLQLK